MVFTITNKRSVIYWEFQARCWKWYWSNIECAPYQKIEEWRWYYLITDTAYKYLGTLIVSYRTAGCLISSSVIHENVSSLCSSCLSQHVTVIVPLVEWTEFVSLQHLRLFYQQHLSLLEITGRVWGISRTHIECNAFAMMS